jgi:hypothetical protein
VIPADRTQSNHAISSPLPRPDPLHVSVREVHRSTLDAVMIRAPYANSQLRFDGSDLLVRAGGLLLPV